MGFIMGNYKLWEATVFRDSANELLELEKKLNCDIEVYRGSTTPILYIWSDYGLKRAYQGDVIKIWGNGKVSVSKSDRGGI